MGQDNKTPGTQTPNPPPPEAKRNNEAPIESPNRNIAVFVAAPPACNPSTVTVCNTAISVPFYGALGSTYTLAMPIPNQDKTFAVECLSTGPIASYQVVNASSLLCSTPRCPDAALNICGVPIPVTGGANLGDIVDVPIPVSALGSSAAYNHVSFKAACTATADGNAQYQISDDSNISCNIFPCPDTSIRLCETSIPITGGANLGEVLHLTMPAPFANDPFQVSCVGTLGQAPMYQITDSSSVTCLKMPGY